MNFLKHYFTEVEATPRKGISHIYGGESGEYSMKPQDFLEIIKFIKDRNNGILSNINMKLSEKADGFSLKIGLDSEDNFFIESSHSGPVFDEGKFREFTIGKSGQTNPISEGYEDILSQLKHNSRLQSYLKSINTENGIKIQTEAFYLPIGKKSESDDSVVSFVATWYKKEKLGSWASFIVINATDGRGKQLYEETVQSIKEDLHDLSTNSLKFDFGDITDFDQIDMNPEIRKVEQLVNSIEEEYGEKIDDIINNPSRVKTVSEQKRKIKQALLLLQKEFADKLGGLIADGKFGPEYEGIVMNLGQNIMFKVVSSRFKEAKKQYNQGYKSK